jgi:hypothetical protein
MEYSAGLTSKLFWLQESKKTAEYILKGFTKEEIKAIAWEENIYQVRAEYRAYEVLNGTYRRMNLLSKELLEKFLESDIQTSKVINLIAIMQDSRIFFEFMHEVFKEKRNLGEKELTDRDLNVYFDRKIAESEEVAKWTEVAVKKLKQCFTRMLFEAGVLSSSKSPRMINDILIDYRVKNLLEENGLKNYLNAIIGDN